MRRHRHVLLALVVLFFGGVAVQARDGNYPPQADGYADAKKRPDDVYTAGPPDGQQWYDDNGNRLPGKFLLNMLIKNEEEHLERTLPAWAKIIDCWIIGVDDNNTDSSPEIIMRHLGHIPGRIVTVHFDGMGPSWTKLVEAGIEHYPECTHGIVSDADFKPMQTRLDRMQLDVRCSKHMYTIWTEDQSTSRRMDWIYRNIPGSKVERRVHQTVYSPKLPNQEVFQTLIDLNIQEQEGGYMDRTGKKSQLYIMHLLKDLEDYPNDPRTLYYLGHTHFDIFFNQRNSGEPVLDEHWEALNEAVRWFKKRAAIKGNYEERWFARLKLGEIHERFLNNWDNDEDGALHWYTACTEQDPHRADAWFYLGQWYRLRQRNREAIPYLKVAAELRMPERSLFQWQQMYDCLSHVEYARAVSGLGNEASVAELEDFVRIQKSAGQCQDQNEGREMQEINRKMKRRLKDKKKALKTSRQNPNAPKLAPVKNMLSFWKRNRDQLQSSFGDSQVFESLRQALEPLRIFFLAHKDHKSVTCRDFRRASRDYLVWSQDSSVQAQLKALADGELKTQLRLRHNHIKQTCF